MAGALHRLEENGLRFLAILSIGMSHRFQMEYWKDGRWFVGRLPQVPGVFSQGATLNELEENLRDAYRMMLAEQEKAPGDLHVETKEIELPA